MSRTIGMRVMPPTSRILSTSLQSIFASRITISQIVLHFSTRWRVIFSNSSRVNSSFMLLPLWLCTIVGPRPARELDLRGQRAALQVLITLQIEQRIFAVLAIKFFRDPVDDHVVPIFAAEPMIAVGREHLDLVAFDPHDRDVESAAAEIEHENRLVFVEFVEAVGERGRRRLVDDLENVQPGELAGGDRRGPLGVIEVSRNGDDRVGHWLLEIFFRVGFELLAK